MKANPERIKKRLCELADISRTENGICRLSYSDTFWKSNSYIAEKMQEAGMCVYTNPVGNVVGTYAGQTQEKIVIGSHIDSVANGGMFDGCLGVIAGIEAVQRLHESGITPQHTVDVVSFAEEEGLVIAGLVGSRAYCGLPPTPVMQEKMENFGFTARDFADAKANGPLAYSIELHIEQGGILEHQKIDIGVVSAIVALKRCLVTFSGAANHAGTTPMHLRNDALVKAARFIQRVQEVTMETDSEMVGTVGRIQVIPNAMNVIPGEVRLTLELRAQRETSIERAYQRLMEEFPKEMVSCELTMQQAACPMDTEVRQAIHEACQLLGLTARNMGSGAGHDTISLEQVTRAGMIFVPSVNGISHSREEETKWMDVENGANVLLQTFQILDRNPPIKQERRGS